MLATCYSYKGHTVYSDGRLYQYGCLVRRYATEARAKAAATRRRAAQLAEWGAEHHQRISDIVGA